MKSKRSLAVLLLAAATLPACPSWETGSAPKLGDEEPPRASDTSRIESPLPEFDATARFHPSRTMVTPGSIRQRTSGSWSPDERDS